MFSSKNATWINPVTPTEEVVRLGIVVGHFCNGGKVCFKAEAELHPSQGDMLGVQHKGRSVGWHVVHSLGIRPSSSSAAWQHSWGFCLLSFLILKIDDGDIMYHIINSHLEPHGYKEIAC